ncbi:hypothetical protein [Micromonospora pisi]|uniref:hypothetical protein n=1 Tax=Micromonospora pisi TaxID=589240 RepID=UPI0011C36D8E|nr:hypothetical protein [Micromonospora pisi]
MEPISSTAILDALRPEWVSLLAMLSGNAQRFYQRPGYRYAGPYRSGSDGPVLDLLFQSADGDPSPP